MTQSFLTAKTTTRWFYLPFASCFFKNVLPTASNTHQPWSKRGRKRIKKCGIQTPIDLALLASPVWAAAPKYPPRELAPENSRNNGNGNNNNNNNNKNKGRDHKLIVNSFRGNFSKSLCLPTIDPQILWPLQQLDVVDKRSFCRMGLKGSSSKFPREMHQELKPVGFWFG